MKKQLAIIELETHAPLLEKWFLLLKDLPDFDFHFYVHFKVKSKLSFIPENKLTLVESVEEIPVKEYHLVIVNTFHRHFEQYLNVFNETKSIVVLHNLNFSIFFKDVSVSNLFLERSKLLYFLKLYFKENVLKHRKHILKLNNIAVLSENLSHVIEAKLPFQKTYFFNLNYCKSIHSDPNEEIQIVIPGNVSPKRKNLNLVFSTFPKLKPISKLHFIFLGKPENIRIAKKLSLLNLTCNDFVKITYFENYVPQGIYDKFITKADVLFCPIKERTSFYGVTEIYGKTKVSGNENDCIFNGKLGLFPDFYPAFNWVTNRYSTENDLVHYFNSLTFEKLEVEYKGMSVLSEKFTFDKVRNRLKNQLLEIIQS